MVNVANKDCTSAVIQKCFDSVADMSRPVDAGIFIQCHTAFRAIRKAKDICTAFQRQYRPLHGLRISRPREPYLSLWLNAQRSPDNTDPEGLFVSPPR